MLPSSVRIFVCTTPQDMRRSFDRLALVAKELGEDPQNGAIFVFPGKRPTRLKILWWDRNGYCLLYKRLHQALFKFPAGNNSLLQIDANSLAQLLAGISVEKEYKIH